MLAELTSPVMGGYIEPFEAALLVLTILLMGFLHVLISRASGKAPEGDVPSDLHESARPDRASLNVGPTDLSAAKARPRSSPIDDRMTR